MVLVQTARQVGQGMDRALATGLQMGTALSRSRTLRSMTAFGLTYGALALAAMVSDLWLPAVGAIVVVLLLINVVSYLCESREALCRGALLLDRLTGKLLSLGPAVIAVPWWQGTGLSIYQNHGKSSWVAAVA